MAVDHSYCLPFSLLFFPGILAFSSFIPHTTPLAECYPSIPRALPCSSIFMSS